MLFCFLAGAFGAKRPPSGEAFFSSAGGEAIFATGASLVFSSSTLFGFRACDSCFRLTSERTTSSPSFSFVAFAGVGAGAGALAGAGAGAGLELRNPNRPPDSGSFFATPAGVGVGAGACFTSAFVSTLAGAGFLGASVFFAPKAPKIPPAGAASFFFGSSSCATGAGAGLGAGGATFGGVLTGISGISAFCFKGTVVTSSS
mmetsp:Transcript_20811/g.27383  ORF Transcript_20811/g.27383 Transcript_20811/m.27383 type:complete len:202 (+) Transcript_20811:1628-2233(+)